MSSTACNEPRGVKNKIKLKKEEKKRRGWLGGLRASPELRGFWTGAAACGRGWPGQRPSAGTGDGPGRANLRLMRAKRAPRKGAAGGRGRCRPADAPGPRMRRHRAPGRDGTGPERLRWGRAVRDAGKKPLPRHPVVSPGVATRRLVFFLFCPRRIPLFGGAAKAGPSRQGQNNGNGEF